jgi:hypothetical protein
MKISTNNYRSMLARSFEYIKNTDVDINTHEKWTKCVCKYLSQNISAKEMTISARDYQTLMLLASYVDCAYLN